MSEQEDQKNIRMLWGMFVVNGLLSRLNPIEIEVEEVWEFVDALIESGEDEPRGILAIKPKRKYTRKAI